jgi:hypothetical protein
MAFVTLTDPQKDILQTDPGFITETKWGVLNKATYWAGQDGTAVPGGQTPTALARWAKSRAFAAQISLNQSIAENPAIIKYFLFQAKNIACVDDQVSPFSPSQVVAKMLGLASFDALADQWFDSQIGNVPF